MLRQGRESTGLMSEAHTPSGAAVTGSKDTSFFGHPRGLAVLFVAEMWERFSYYGMRALLILYLTQHFLFSDEKAAGLYAAYASLVYLMPVAGGFIADKYLGPRKAVTIGAILLSLGHFGMAFEGDGSTQYLEYEGGRIEIVSEGRGDERVLFAESAGERRALSFSAEEAQLEAGDEAAAEFIPTGAYDIETVQQPLYVQILFLSLSLIIVGVGFLKANIATIVGALYDHGDPRRDRGFTIFYMGINLGSLMATILCGWLGIAYGWKYGFGLAGFGMLAGLITFLAGQSWLEGRADPPNEAALKKPVTGPISLEALIWIGGLLALLPTWALIQRLEIVSTALMIVAPGMFIVMFGYTFLVLEKEERDRMIVALTLTMFSVLFWLLFEQSGSSLTLFADRNTDMTIAGDLRMNAPQTQFFNASMIVLLAPVFAMLWTALDRRGMEPSVPVKFAIGLVLAGLGFLTLVFAGTTQADENAMVPLIWLVLIYLFHTMGELCLSPVGNSMITKLSVGRLVGLMMGMWYLAISLASILGGVVAKMAATDTIGGVVVDPREQLDTFVQVYTWIGGWGVGIGVLLLLISPILKRRMHGVR